LAKNLLIHTKEAGRTDLYGKCPKGFPTLKGSSKIFFTFKRRRKMAGKYILKLYITGQTANSQRALINLENVLNNELKGLYTLKVIDVLKDPQLAEEEKILATPTLAKVLPLPIRRIIGDLSDKEKVLLGLDLTVESQGESEG